MIPYRLTPERMAELVAFDLYIDEGHTARPNPRYMKDTAPAFEWYAFFEMWQWEPRSGGKMADYIEVADG